MNIPIFRPPAPEPRETRPNLIALLWLLVNNPLEVWSRDHFEKPIVRDGLPFMPAIIVNDPDWVRHVLLDNAANYRKDDLLLRILNSGLGQGLLTVEGQQWRRQRHAAAPMFARRTIHGFADAMNAAIAGLVSRWSRLDSAETVDIAREAGNLTLDVLRRTILSEGFDESNESVLSSMRTYFDSIGRIDPMDALGLPAFLPRPTRGPEREALNFFKKTVEAIIAKRRAAEEPPRDLLSLLLDAASTDELTEEEVRANVLTFIAAGHETTANAITWSLYLLGQDRAWCTRIAEEADNVPSTEDQSGDPCASLRLSRAVVEEALRLYPPIAAISRVAIAPDEIAGERVEPGTMVIVSPYVLHRHRLLWRDPDVFDPERFLEPARSTQDRFSYLPFGAGPRTCIGAAFALQEATLAVSAVARHFRWELASGFDVRPLLRITLRPKDGLPMHVSSRHSAEQLQ